MIVKRSWGPTATHLPLAVLTITKVCGVPSIVIRAFRADRAQRGTAPQATVRAEPQRDRGVSMSRLLMLDFVVHQPLELAAGGRERTAVELLG